MPGPANQSLYGLRVEIVVENEGSTMIVQQFQVQVVVACYLLKRLMQIARVIIETEFGPSAVPIRPRYE